MCADSDKIVGMVLNHFVKLREIPAFRDSRILFMVEANSGWDRCDAMYRALSVAGLQNIEMVTRLTKLGGPLSTMPVTANMARVDLVKELGVWTDQHRKRKGVESLTTSLYKGQLAYSEHFVSHTHPVETVKEQIELQLNNFRHDIKVPLDQSFGKFKETWSGKGGEGMRDDLVACLQLLKVLVDEICQDAAFLQRCQQNGWLVPGSFMD